MGDIAVLANVIVNAGGATAEQRAAWAALFPPWLEARQHRLGVDRRQVARNAVEELLTAAQTGAPLNILSASDAVVVVAFMLISAPIGENPDENTRYMIVLNNIRNLQASFETLHPDVGTFKIRGIESSGITLKYEARRLILLKVFEYMTQNPNARTAPLAGIVESAAHAHGIGIPAYLRDPLTQITGPLPFKSRDDVDGPWLLPAKSMVPILAWNIQSENQRRTVQAFIKKWNRFTAAPGERLTLA